MANIIKPKRSTVAAKVPTTAQMSSGEIAVNSTDQKIYTYDGTSILQIGAGKLSGLGDVVLTSLTSGQAITWNGTTWVNSTVSGGGSSVTIGTTAPGSPSAGNLWWNSEEGKLKIYYTDANTSQWVDSFISVKGDTGPAGTNGTNGQGVVIGGTVGQALVKLSSTDYDTSWSNIVAGSTTQIQYNNGGVLSASANFTYDSTTGTLSLLNTDAEVILNGITNEPASPASGQLSLYSKNVGGRMMLKQKGPSGLDTPLQPSFYQNKVSFWSPPGNTTTLPAVWGFDNFSSIVASGSTTTARAVASTNILTRSRRLGYVGAAVANNYAGIFHPNAQWTVGDAAGLGGFYFVVRFALPAGNASHAFFVGLGSGTAVQTNGTGVDPATLTNSIGVGASVGDTNMRIMYGGSAAQTPVTTNTNFAKTASTNIFELVMFAPTNSNNTVNYRLSKFVSGTSTFELSGTLTGVAGTALPANTTFLTPRIWSHCGAVTVAAQIDIISIYLETDY